MRGTCDESNMAPNVLGLPTHVLHLEQGMKLPLEEYKDLKRWAPLSISWTSCQPFIENSRAVLIHRPRKVATLRTSEKYKSHIGMQCWCGNGFSGSKKFTFLDAPPDGKLLCARCEENAVAAGLPTSEQLVGRHVHTGKVVAVQVCCGEIT